MPFDMLRTSSTSSSSSAFHDRKATPIAHAKDSAAPRGGNKTRVSTSGDSSSTNNSTYRTHHATQSADSNGRTAPRSIPSVPSSERRLAHVVGQEQSAQQLRELRLPQPAKWRLGQDRNVRAQVDQGNGTAASQELRSSWISVHENEEGMPPSNLAFATDSQHKQQGKQASRQKEQRWSVGTHMSAAHYRHLDQATNMRLLSDETPPDDMDASWGLDALDDDAEMERQQQQQQEEWSHSSQAENTRGKTEFSPNHPRRPHTATPGIHHNSNDPNSNDIDHGYGNMNYDEQPDTPTATRRGVSAAPRQPQARLDDDNELSHHDMHSSNSSYASAHLMRTVTPPPPQSQQVQQQPSSNTSKFPWRDSKLDNIFMDLLAKECSAPPSREPTPGPANRGNHQRAASPYNPGPTEASASLSFGEIMDALNNVEDSMEYRRNPASASKESDPAQASRQRKFAKARERLAQLTPPVQELQRSREASLLPDKPAPGAHLSIASNGDDGKADEDHEALEKQRQTVIKAAMAMDPNDDRSVAPASSAKSHREDILAKRKLALRRLACKTDLDLTSFGSRRPTQETDRVSTTSRDSVYRDSISGSTLGPISAGPVENGVAKAETAAQEILALKVDALFQDSGREIEARRSSILPLLLNQKSTEAVSTKGTLNLADNHQPHIFAQNRRTSLDPEKAKQYETLASKRLEKQTSSFVEQLANATDSALRSTSIDLTHKTSSTSPIKGEESSQDRPDDEDEELRWSTGMEDAFKCLDDIDLELSMDAQIEVTQRVQRPRSLDGNNDNLLTGVMLPSKPRRKGEYSLRWEAQLEGDHDGSSHEHVQPSLDQRRKRRTSLPVDDNMTGNISTATALMPEQASFSHAEGHLIRYITSLYPWDEWDQVKTLDLTKREVESTINLNHLVPNLETLNLNENQVTYLTGVPKSVRTLLVKSNQLSDLTNFAHLANLQYLDVSNNGIEDLTGLSSLGHLRELIAVNNQIKSVAALQQMDGLIRLDVSRNCLQTIDFKWSKLQRLEYFNASYNQIEQLDNLESLTGLIHANLGHNSIEDISLVQPLKRLRILNLTQNRLAQFDARPFPNLKTLYLDDNRLETLQNCASLVRLENFSVRDQEGDGTAIDMTEFLNSRKLYLSGNPVHSLDLSAGFYQLEYLEICAGCLSDLPPDFASLMPNLRGLNLSYNELDSLASLEGLHRLRRLVFVGNNLKRFNSVLALVKRLRSLVTLDLRHNPLTSNMYPVMSVRQGASPYQDTYRTGQMSAMEADWRRRDVAFRRALPDSMYLKRSVYRAAIMKACKRLEWFDGAVIQDKEREKVPYVLGELLDRAGHVLMRREDDDEENEDEYFGYDGNEYDHGDNHGGDDDPKMLMTAARAHGGDLLPRIKPFVLADRRSILSGATTLSSNVTTSSQGRRDSRQSPDLRHHTRWMAHAPAPAPVRTSGARVAEGTRGAESPCPRGDSTTLRPRQTGASLQHTLVGGDGHQSIHHKRAPSFSPLIVDGRTQQQQYLRKQQREDQDDHRAPSVRSDSSDRRSAVRNWRDEVNEVSQHRNMVSATPRSTSSASRASSARQPPPPPQQQQQPQSHPSSGISSARSSRLPPPRASTGPPPTTLTLAIHQKLAQATNSPRASYQHHGRRRSDGVLHHGANFSLGGRGIAAGAGTRGSPRIEFSRVSPMTPRCMSQSVQLTRPTHLRRRSFGLYHPQASIARRREINDHNGGQHPPMTTSPQEYLMSMSVPAGGFETPAAGATASPSYFMLSHHHGHHHGGHGHQTPHGGMSRSVHNAIGGGGRSVPNTPSKANAVANGRLSQQGYPFHTLARDMERDDM